jgi:hypothetical protein
MSNATRTSINLGTTLSINRGGGAAAIPWYLSGGIVAANCIAAYQPKGAASLAASYVNLANPGTYNLTNGHATPVNWGATTGWKGNGTVAYFKTGLIPSGALSFAGVFLDISSNLSVYGQADDDNVVGTHSNKLFPNYSSAALWSFIANKEIYATPIVSSGLHTFAASSSGRLYIDGSLHTNAGAVSWSGTARELYIMASNVNGNATAKWGTGGACLYAISIYDIPLTATHVTALHVAMAAL